MSDLTVVDPKGWEYDLHSIYSAYIGYFQLHAVPWYARSWGYVFTSFASFLAFSWPVITVTDRWTHLPHIVTRHSSVGAFVKMVKTRFGETLPQPPNILIVSPFESSPRPLRSLSSYASYKRLHDTLPAMVLNALKMRVRMGDPLAVREIWGKPLSLLVSEEGFKSPRTGKKEESNQGRDKTFLAIDFKRNDRGGRNVLEWGYAVVVCGQLNAPGHWPPVPEKDYRKGYYIATDHENKVRKRQSMPDVFPDHMVVSKAKLPQIIQAVISSFASPDSETTPNTLVLVTHGVSENLEHFEDMGIRLPHNVLILDTAAYERALYVGGFRGTMPDPKSPFKPRSHSTTLSLENLFRSLTAPDLEWVGSSIRGKKLGHRVSASLSSNTTSKTLGIQQRKIFEYPLTIQAHASVPLLDVTMYQAENNAFICLLSLQALLEPTTRFPRVEKTMGSVQPPSNTRRMRFETMTPRVLDPWAYLGVNGYHNPHIGGYILYPALTLPSYKISSHRRHSTIPPTHPNTPNSMCSSFASTVAASHLATILDSESCRSSHGVEAWSTASITYDLAEELKQMQVERASSKVLRQGGVSQVTTRNG
ncbi:hypothetical protein BDZ94DRAFT_1312889 [Collybia nuda]|uniref:Gfd2/YDR514C-like C-terminal domain-containing protein n=1 Tax=Collybia nuda TaxID=64659 RepID=A0A9P5XY51_9AGAR|nr:hypothetical protein BDZ94DRAFT_1312889 [Collybia nuda]